MAKVINVPTLAAINNKIKELELVKEKIERLTKHKGKTVNDEILKCYISMQNVSAVAEYINAEGYKIASCGKDGERSYISNDISNILKATASEVGVDIEIHSFAKSLFKYNKGMLSWNMLLKSCV